MDYSLLLGIETLQQEYVGDMPSFDDAEHSTKLMHQIGASRMTVSRTMVDQTVKEVELIDVGERMSLRHCFKSGGRVFHISIIDILQEWNLNKKSERFVKTYLMGKDGDKLSAIEP